MRPSLRRARAATAGRRDPERGSSLVEVLVAGVVLGIVALGSTQVLISNDRTVALSEQQIEASRIAANELDVMRSMPYDELGIAPSAVGYVSTFEGRPTVTEAVNRVAPLGAVTRNDVTYTVTRQVTWQAVGAVATAYKKVTIVVTWSGTREYRLDGGFREVGGG